MKKLKESTGTCKYCKQAAMIKAPEDTTQEELDEIATKECSCEQAQFQRKREMRFEAAKTYLENVLNEKYPIAYEASVALTKAVFERQLASGSFKTGKYTYTVSLDGDECIKVKKVYKSTEEETF